MYADGASLYGIGCKPCLVFIPWKFHVVGVLAVLLEPKECEERFHVPIYNAENLLSCIRKEKAIVLIGFAEVVVIIVREILLGTKVVLTDGIQPHIVEACGVIAQHFQCCTILGATGALCNMYFVVRYIKILVYL